jgi:hypothetical protein
MRVELTQYAILNRTSVCQKLYTWNKSHIFKYENYHCAYESNIYEQ